MTKADALYWKKTLEGLGIQSPNALAFYPELAKAYTSPERAYHNLDHLDSMFEVLTPLQLEAPFLVQLAVWFHDLVYDVSRQDNEARSALSAQHFGQSYGLDQADIDTLEELILSTAGHTPRRAHPDYYAMLDADLSTLARSPEAYDRYAAAIRKEYSRYPGFLYKRGRRKVLRSFLERDQLYYTAKLQAQWEDQARANLARELKHLGG